MILITTAFGDEFHAIGRAIHAGRIADRPCQAIMTGIGPRAARRALSELLDRSSQIDLVLSIGIAASLTAPWQAFDRALIQRVTARLPTDKRIPSPSEPGGFASALHRLGADLRQQLRCVDLVSVARPVLTSAEKSVLGVASGAQLCDMETYALAAVCAQRGIPWIGGRIVSDTASETLPHWLVTLSKLIAARQWKRAVGLVATHPQDLPSLLRLGLRMRRLKPALTQFTTDIVSHVLPA